MVPMAEKYGPMNESPWESRCCHERPVINGLLLLFSKYGTAHGESCISAHIIPMHCFGWVAGVDLASIGVSKS